MISPKPASTASEAYALRHHASVARLRRQVEQGACVGVPRPHKHRVWVFADQQTHTLRVALLDGLGDRLHRTRRQLLDGRLAGRPRRLVDTHQDALRANLALLLWTGTVHLGLG